MNYLKMLAYGLINDAAKRNEKDGALYVQKLFGLQPDAADLAYWNFIGWLCSRI